ncbi:MAG: COR domain-containing protein [Anaerolineales bacterium]
MAIKQIRKIKVKTMPHDQAYLQAEKKIEEALKSGATKLNLSDMSLTELPESIGELTQLQVLNLGHNWTVGDDGDEWNHLTVLPKSLGELSQLKSLDLSCNQFMELPEFIGKLTELETLSVYKNHLETLPDSLERLAKIESLEIDDNKFKKVPDVIGRFLLLKHLNLSANGFTEIPEWILNLQDLEFLSFGNLLGGNPLKVFPPLLRHMTQLKELSLYECQLSLIPDWIGELNQLEDLWLGKNSIVSIPQTVASLRNIRNLRVEDNLLSEVPQQITELVKLARLELDNNPLKPELAEASKQGAEAVKLFLRAGPVVPVYEAKLILVGEGEVGKTCLMDALLDKKWQDHPSTHGIEIQQIKVTDPEIEKEITINSWDFGGQRVYRPTHQLFFSAPAVYLVVWKPREGPQQGFVKEWIQLVKRREPSAKILVVATHGGPQQRQPDIDRQELWDLFGKDTVVDFFFVDSKPDKKRKRKGIAELKGAIAHVAAELPEVGRSVPKSFADVRAALGATGAPYLPLDEVLAICRAHNMDDEIARLFITISHRLGHLTHYENDPALRDIVILRPDWLASAMSYVLDDEETRKAHGLVDFSRLGHLWDDSTRPTETRYPATLHHIFLRLMERFDLSYRVAGLSKDEDSNPISLIAQLVPDTTPKEEDFTKAWAPKLASGDIQQTQICRIVDAQNGQSANAEGLFFQLIVRLHKYSLGRIHYNDSVHWQRGLILDANYNGRALLRHIGNDVHITVRAAYPEYFLGSLTSEVKFLVESFWEGLRCEITVPCLNPSPCKGLFEVSKLIEIKREGQPKYPCPICNSWQNIDSLLRNAPVAAQPVPLESLLKEFAQVKDTLNEVNDTTKRILSQADKQYADFIQLFTDEAKEGPRLFSLFPLDGNKFNPQTWVREKFRLVLWCEHSRLPLPVLNDGNMQKGVYDFEFDREWFKQAAPYLKFVTGTLSLVLPVASSALKVTKDAATQSLQDKIGFGKEVIDAIAGTGTAFAEIMGATDSINLKHGVRTRAENATLRELHALLKAKDPGYGGLVRVMNKRQEFLWVHEKYASEY